jgi:hypothetical protein
MWMQQSVGLIAVVKIDGPSGIRWSATISFKALECGQHSLAAVRGTSEQLAA